MHALDAALREALQPAPAVAGRGASSPTTRCASCPATAGTDAVTRVLVESTDHEREWTTVGVHGNIVEASWLALCDALVHKAMRLPQPVISASP